MTVSLTPGSQTEVSSWSPGWFRPWHQLNNTWMFGILWLPYCAVGKPPASPLPLEIHTYLFDGYSVASLRAMRFLHKVPKVPITYIVISGDWTQGPDQRPGLWVKHPP